MNDRLQLLSALIALGSLAAMGLREGWTGTLALLPLPARALAMIWYSGTISRAFGRGRGLRRATHPAPPAAIRALGWVLLLVPLILIILQRLRAA